MQRLLSVAALLILAGVCHATTVVREPFSSLVDDADGIVLATVRSVVSRAAPDGNIYTFVTLQPEQAVKGRLQSPTFTVRMLGGEAGGIGLEVVGGAHFERGERVVVFLRDNGKADVPFVGWTQGVFRVEADPTGAQRVVDHSHNRVLRIEGDRVIAERRYRSAATIIEDPTDASRHLAPAGGAGRPVDPPGITRIPGSATTSSDPPGLLLKDFLDAIARELAVSAAGDSSGEIASVEDFSNLAPGKRRLVSPGR